MEKIKTKYEPGMILGTDKECCKVEAIVSMDDRGQMVIPKEVRDRAKIVAGEKLALTSWYKNDEVCCITLFRVSDLSEMVKRTFGPVLKEIL